MSNAFMTLAWYGHLKFKDMKWSQGLPLLVVILISWGIALFEYMLQVPANRWGHDHFSAAELKTIQEVVTLVVFAVFSVVWLKEPLGWNHALGFLFIAVSGSSRSLPLFDSMAILGRSVVRQRLKVAGQVVASMAGSGK